MHRLIVPAAFAAASFLFVAVPAAQAATPEPMVAGSLTDVSAQERRFERRFERRINRQIRRMTRPHAGPRRCVTERTRIVRPNGAVTFRTVQRCR
jgi:hypothetical protein